jgi:hypothetical protein
MAGGDKFEQGIRKILNDLEGQDLNLKIYLTNFLNLNLF